MTENLDQLRQVAESATQTDWHPVLVGFPGREVWLVDSELSFICSTQVGDERGERDSLHIATFDPSTVLALIERVEAAEAAVQRVESLAGEWVRSGNGHWRDLHRVLDGGEPE